MNVLQAKTEVIYRPPRKGYHTENAVPGAKAMAENVEVIALADLFRDRLEGCHAQLRAVGTSLKDEYCFVDGCTDRVGADVVGTKGTSNCENRIQGDSEWKFQGQVLDPYEQEHIDLIESIRSGKPLNEAKQVAESTVTAIMGRKSAYSGQEITWEAAMNSQWNYTPKQSFPRACALGYTIPPPDGANANCGVPADLLREPPGQETRVPSA